MAQKVAEYLNSLEHELRAAGRSEAAETIQTVLNEYHRQHWYEMSLALLKIMCDPFILERAYDLYENMLVTIRFDISPIAYVKLVYSVVFSPHSTLEKALSVVEGASANLMGNGAMQEMRATECIRALLLLSNNEKDGNEEDVAAAALAAVPGSGPYVARKLLEELDTYIGELQMHEAEPLLLALYYKARGRDYELRKQYTKFYRNAFDVVTYAEKAEMPMLPQEMTLLAFKTVVAAILSEEIFNFGKVLNCEPLVRALENSKEHEWILEWLRLCNEGDVEGFQRFMVTHGNEMKQVSGLFEAAATVLRRKVRLAALLHLAFYTPFNERTFSFQSIAKRCVVEEPEVEPLLLAALAQGIVQGRIDGVLKKVHISWVEPRVLRLQEVKQLAQHVAKWQEQVMGVSSYVSKMVEKLQQ